MTVMSLVGPLQSRLLMQFAIDVGPPHDTPMEGGLIARHIPLLGGEVSGDHSGVITPGADRQVIHLDGRIEITADYGVALEEGEVAIESRGVRYLSPEARERVARGESPLPGQVYFRTSVRFRTQAPALIQLNRLLAVSVGARPKDRVLLDIYAIL
jgi:hypothetical protein